MSLAAGGMDLSFLRERGGLSAQVGRCRGKVTIGRDPSWTVCIDDLAVPRQHAVIEERLVTRLARLDGVARLE